MPGKRAIDAPVGAGGGAIAPLRAGSLLASFRYAGAGLRWALGTQRTFRVQAAASVLVLASIRAFPVRPVEAALLIGAIAAVIVAELFNTAAEALVDLACPQVHPLAKVVKDVAAAAVVVTAAAAALIGTVILWPHIRNLF